MGQPRSQLYCLQGTLPDPCLASPAGAPGCLGRGRTAPLLSPCLGGTHQLQSTYLPHLVINFVENAAMLLLVIPSFSFGQANFLPTNSLTSFSAPISFCRKRFAPKRHFETPISPNCLPVWPRRCSIYGQPFYIVFHTNKMSLQR